MHDRAVTASPEDRSVGTAVASVGAPADSVSERVTYRIAEAEDRSVTELDPLYNSIDPEALDALVDSLSAPDASITFTHEDYTITVDVCGTISIDLSDR